MRYDPAALSLSFTSQAELEAFHLQLSNAVRSAMIGATRHIQDPREAKRASSVVLRQLAVLMRALNVIRAKLPRKVP